MLIEEYEEGKLMKSRAVNYLKCLAALLVIHTHLDKMYPSSLNFLVWGGGILLIVFFSLFRAIV